MEYEGLGYKVGESSTPRGKSGYFFLFCPIFSCFSNFFSVGVGVLGWGKPCPLLRGKSEEFYSSYFPPFFELGKSMENGASGYEAGGSPATREKVNGNVFVFSFSNFLSCGDR